MLSAVKHFGRLS